MSETRVLLVDDDEALGDALSDALEQYGFDVRVARDWVAALAELERHHPDVIVLDQRLGRVDTLARLPELRQRTEAPIIMLTANNNETDRIIGLETGADDFLVKPITSRELIARVRSQLRRQVRAPGTVVASAWKISRQERRLYRPDGSVVSLTGAQFSLLDCLAAANGEPLSREELTRTVLLRSARADDRSIDNLVYQLRQKIRDAGGGDAIVALRNRGYAFAGFFTGEE
ncbi:response regulator transcription factor [Rhodovarius crocodyli]|uniref:response regulator transcription factor n=1 Tax=Rhodovarius crocodyli TaxID=1979269 RepID=UPI0013E28D3B|nr:response regulator transcription factor [Rhodovarius crocodyli]